MTPSELARIREQALAKPTLTDTTPTLHYHRETIIRLCDALQQAWAERDNVAFEMEGWKQKNFRDNEYLIAELQFARLELDRLRAEL